MKKGYKKPTVTILVLSSQKMICLSFDGTDHTENWNVEDSETI